MIYLFIAFVTVFLMFLVAMHYGYTLAAELIRLREKNEELQRKVDAWVTWSEDKLDNPETKEEKPV